MVNWIISSLQCVCGDFVLNGCSVVYFLSFFFFFFFACTSLLVHPLYLPSVQPFCTFCLVAAFVLQLLLCISCFISLLVHMFCCFYSVLVVLLTSEWIFPALFCWSLSQYLYSILSFVSWSSATPAIFSYKSFVSFLLIAQRGTRQIVSVCNLDRRTNWGGTFFFIKWLCTLTFLLLFCSFAALLLFLFVFTFVTDCFFQVSF